ncbi:Inclusion body clearance protein IML2 [Bienertia sinuspersici]
MSSLQHLGCSRSEAIVIAKEIVRKHFIHHVFRGSHFEDGNEVYRFLEHEQFIPKCFNFRGSIDDTEPESALRIGERLMKIMSAILESYASEDMYRLDYLAISNSEEFRRYVNMIQSLQRVDLFALSPDEKLAFFLNLYNAMVIHAVIRRGYPEGLINRKSFVTDFQYLVGGNPYSLNTIRNGILRGNQRAPYALVKPFTSGDNRLQIALSKVNPLIHFGLCDGSKSSPRVRFFSPQNVQAELRAAAREFFRNNTVEVDLSNRTVYLTCLMKWYSVDFGNEKDNLKWIMSYLDADKAGLLTHLIDDGGVINVVYQDYDWSINS